MNHRSRWGWVAVVTLVLALTGAWLTAASGDHVPPPAPLVRQ